MGICVLAAPALHASVSFTGNGGQGTDGNIMTFSSGSFVVTASAWSTTGNSNTTFANASLGQYSFGLGVCNDVEIASNSTCTSNPPEHAIGNSGNFDFVLLTFSQPVTSVSLVLSTFNTAQDTDVTYYVGSCGSVPNNTVNCGPNGKTLANINTIAGLSNVQTHSDLTTLTTNRTVTLDLTGTGSAGVNWVLVGATTLTNYTGNDYFKLESMSYTTTPEPATFGLAGAALLGLGLLRSRKKRALNS